MNVTRHTEGIFGGTFDPVHLGHLSVARAARELLHLDRIRLIPAGIPPHKMRQDVAQPDDRLRMLALAVEGSPEFVLDDREVRRSGPSYTVDTLRDLIREFPETRFTLLIGRDNVKDFSTWRDPEGILALVQVAVLARPGTATEVPPLLAGRIVEVPTPLHDVSSSDIRRRVREGLPIETLVTPPVARYISDHRLYRNG